MALGLSIRRVVMAWLVVVAGLPLWASAQEPMPPKDASKPGALREQTIYVPYAKLRAMFEKEGRGVFLPYEKFQELWKAAQGAAQKVEDGKPPLGSIITQIDSQATIQKDVVSVSAKISIDLLTDGWHEVPLRLSDAAIRSAKIGDEPARVVFVEGQGYKLLYEKKEKEAARIELEIEYSKAFEKAPGANNVSFDAPQAPINRWQITVPETGVKVQVQPNLSTNDAAATPDPKAKETKVEALVGSAPQVQISWNPKAEGAAGQNALATVQVREEVTVEEGVMRTRLQLAYEISRADLKELSFQVPADQNVVNVFDPNVQKWEQKEDKEKKLRTITVSLFQAVRGVQNVAVELEKFSQNDEMAADMRQREFTIPDVKVLDVQRQQGIVVVRLEGSLRGDVTGRTGLLQLDAADLPPPLAGQDWPFAFRYAAHPYALTLSIEKVLPQIEVDELVEVYLEPQQLTLNLLAIFNIEKAGVFQLELDVPEGFDIRQVQGREAAGAAAVTVDSHHVDEVTVDGKKAKTRLIVNLSRKAIGKVALWVELQRRQDDVNLQTPSGKASDVALVIPRVAPAKLQRVTGRLLVYAPASLRITPKEVKGLRSVAVAEALQGVESTRDGRFPLTRELVAYAYTQEPVALELSAERRAPFITAEQLLFVQVESGLVKYEATIDFNVLYSGVKTLRVDVPADLYERKELRLPPAAVKERKMEPQPDDVAKGYVALELSSDGEFLEASSVKFIGERKLADLAVGKSVKIPLPALWPHGVDRNTGKIGAAKSETIDLGVTGTPTGLRPIDPHFELPIDKLPAPAAMAFEFVGDWSLTLVATRYELEDVKRTSIERAFVRMVVTRGAETAVQCLYRIRSAKQRIAIVLPAGVDAKTAFNRQSLRVNNVPVSLETDGTQYFIPLVGHTAEEVVLIDLRYTSQRSATLELPEFPDDPAVQQVYLAAYLPEEQRLLGVSGAWTEEDVRKPGEEVRTSKSDADLLNWVQEGAGASHGVDPFPTDGNRYLYSSLRPASGKAGAITLIAAHRYVLWGIIVLAVAGVGLGLSTRPIGVRLWWLAALVIAVVLSALFAPTFAAAVLGDVFYWSLALVLIVWLVQFLAWALPKAGTWYGSRTARAATMAAAVAVSSPPVTPAPPNEIQLGEVRQTPPNSEGQQGGGDHV
jgi:hypothetical protein